MTSREPSGDALQAVLARQAMPGPQLEVMSAIARTGLTVAAHLRAKGDAAPAPAGESTNRFADEQSSLDVFTDELFRERLGAVPSVAVVATEESPAATIPLAGREALSERYLVVLDPLDGSKNSPVGGTLGSIFAVMRDFVTAGDESRGLADVIFAGYLLYSWETVLVIATATEVTQFTAGPDLAEFFETGTLRLATDGPIYSVNEGLRPGWSDATAASVDRIREGRSLRYTGCLVADFHRVLKEGGIYAYPASVSRPEGKIRLFYEIFPLAHVARTAGGTAATGAGLLPPAGGGKLDGISEIYIGSEVPVRQALGES
ncbi:MAG: hypothetical protein QF664_07785 [Dehalococcoidia bacterium]|jgi:fructose-1,6-bisphosphatase I|nr:hypothetical protein [Dehalococcoidia bacterium]